MITVGVGSDNPVKIKATESAFSKFFQYIQILHKKIDPGIPAQPMSDEEMIRGAINRAIGIYNHFNTDFGVGLEGGIVKYRYGVFVRGWVAVYDGKRTGIASTVSIQIPSIIWEILSTEKSLELEDIMEKISGVRKIGDKIGAFGFLTLGRYDRTRAFEDALICALAPFINKEAYDNSLLREKLYSEM